MNQIGINGLPDTFMRTLLLLLFATFATGATAEQTVRIATFNVSMDASNYQKEQDKITGQELFERLALTDHSQISNIAQIIQRVRPDVILLNEFDYTPDPNRGAKAFLKNYLNHAQDGAKPIDYPYFFTSSVNTGVDSGMDLDNDGKRSGKGGDAFGYGLYPGQYGMLVLSRFPILNSQARTFQHFLWRDLPGNQLAQIRDEKGNLWYGPTEQQQLRLSSKSHWDLPILIHGKPVHLLVSHPTPPVFDGPEDSNGYRNRDELKFWVDYLTPTASGYQYDDLGEKGGLKGSRFVLLGDLNASVFGKESRSGGIDALLAHPAVNNQAIPTSPAGVQLSPELPHAKSYTALWKMRADYVLPSKVGFKVIDQGIFWPEQGTPLHGLVASREQSSDHRLVWLDLLLVD